MIYLYSKRRVLLNKYESTEECSRMTGYGLEKLNECLESPGLIIGSCFVSPYRWRNTKEDRAQYVANVLRTLNAKQLQIALGIIK